MKKYITVFYLLIILSTLIPCIKASSQIENSAGKISQDSSQGQENILIILDSSYSMSEEVDGVRKMDIAKKVINHVLAQLSPDVKVGLRVYGHKSNLFGYKSCTASELKVPISSNSKSAISNALLKIEPVGMTPISYSIEQAANNDFIGTNGVRRIVLVSDGMETCGGDPCDFAISLVKNKIKMKIDVIGFDLSEQAAMSQLKCVALATKGRFYAANNASELEKSLNKSFNVNKEVYGKIIK